MKVFEKRLYAALIDTLLFCSALVLATKLIPAFYFDTLGAFSYLILFIPFFCRDFLFRHASLGKKIMGIAVYDARWMPPSFGALFKRSFLTYTVGYTKYIKTKSLENENAVIALSDWERDVLKTRVVDKKVLLLLQEKVSKSSPTYADDMTRLYNEYLRTCYALQD